MPTSLVAASLMCGCSLPVGAGDPPCAAPDATAAPLPSADKHEEHFVPNAFKRRHWLRTRADHATSSLPQHLGQALQCRVNIGREVGEAGGTGRHCHLICEPCLKPDLLG